MYPTRSSNLKPRVFVGLWLIVSTAPLHAAITYPKVYNDFTFEVAGQHFGFTETEKVAIDEFQQRIVPGKQTIVTLGPAGFVYPSSLGSFALAATAVAGLCAALWSYKRNSQGTG